MELNLIVAFCKNFGIGYQNKIPWNIKEDLQHFQEITKNGIVIMGRETYFSIPEKNRPLKNRINIVLTNHALMYASKETKFLSMPMNCAKSKLNNEYNLEQGENLLFLDFDELQDYLEEQHDESEKKLYVIGGETIYEMFLEEYHIDKIYVTQIDKEYKCDKFFSMPEKFELATYSDNKFSEEEKCNYRFLEYVPSVKLHGEYQYIDLLHNIMNNGNSRDDRTKTGTKSVFGQQIRFNISNSIPLLTTKFVPFKMVVKELLWFLKGQTDNKILQDQGVHIWDGNTTRDFLDKRGLKDYKEGDIGPMYGYILRHCGAEYKGCDKDYTGQGIDQLEEVIKLLKTDPFSRRIAMTTYNVSDLEKGVLHPCHGIYIQFYVEEKNKQKYLSCSMTQRSVDTGCGLPFNIASYAVLTYIIAMKVDMIPNELIISTGDTHIYNNHIEALEEQVKRIPYPFPKLVLKDIKNKKWEELVVDDFELIGYMSHPSIKLLMNV